jgi:hypothetical protein
MVRVLVMSNDSLLADAIVSNLSQETTLDVLRLTHQNPNKVYQALLEDCPVVIIVEDGKAGDVVITDTDLLKSSGCFRLITVSLQTTHLRIFDSYQMPISGITQVIELAKGFDHENWSEAIE